MMRELSCWEVSFLLLVARVSSSYDSVLMTESIFQKITTSLCNLGAISLRLKLPHCVEGQLSVPKRPWQLHLVKAVPCIRPDSSYRCTDRFHPASHIRESCSFEKLPRRLEKKSELYHRFDHGNDGSNLRLIA